MQQPDIYLKAAEIVRAKRYGLGMRPIHAINQIKALAAVNNSLTSHTVFTSAASAGFQYSSRSPVTGSTRSS